MRPLQLTMSAFGSYGKPETIDFTELGDKRLFLIHGPTGSGKTTVLDAICFALYGVALILIPLIGGPWTMIAPVAVFGIAQGILIPNIQNYLGRFSSIENRGIVMSVYGSCIRIGQTLGPLIMGLLLPMFGINGIFFICAALALTLIGFVFVALE